MVNTGRRREPAELSGRTIAAAARPVRIAFHGLNKGLKNEEGLDGNKEGSNPGAASGAGRELSKEKKSRHKAVI